MAVTVQFYNSFKILLGNAGIDLDGHDVRAVPLASAYTFAAAHDFANDLTNEVTTNGGTRVALSTKSWALSGNNARFDCADIEWVATGGPLTIRHVALVNYEGSTSDADRELICLLSSSSDLTAGTGTSVKILTPNGVFEIQ